MKNQKAFTLIEVMIALAIAAGALFWASSTQMNSLKRLFLIAGELNRIYIIKSELYSFFLKPPYAATRVNKVSYDTPSLAVTTRYHEIPKKSDLFLLNDRIRKVVSTGKWKNDGVSQDSLNASLATFIVIPQQKEEQ